MDMEKAMRSSVGTTFPVWAGRGKIFVKMLPKIVRFNVQKQKKCHATTWGG
jgi:hypothetical protein